MTRVGCLLSAFVILYGAPSYASVTLLPPVEMEGQVEQVQGLLKNPEADPHRLHGQAGLMFDQLENTHHLQVGGIGEWEKPYQLAENGEEASLKDMVGHMKGLLIQEPPLPMGSREKEEIRKRLMEDYVALEDMSSKDGVRKAEDGELPEGTAAAYVWDIAKSAKDGAVDGMMLLQPSLVKASKIIGEFVLATVGAHEPRHRMTHIEDAKELADQVKKAEVDAFTDEGALLAWMDPTGEKFMYLWTVTVEREGTPQFVTDYVKHLAKVRHAYSEGRPGVEKLVTELGYQDRDGLFHSHCKGHDHGHDQAEAPTPGAVTNPKG